MVIKLSGVQFGLKWYAWSQNCTTRNWNRPNTGLGQFKYFIDAVLSRFEFKFIHFFSFFFFFWGGGRNSFGNKSCKICHTILFVFYFPAIWLVTLNKPWNLIGCLVFSVASSLALKDQHYYHLKISCGMCVCSLFAFIPLWRLMQLASHQKAQHWKQ